MQVRVLHPPPSLAEASYGGQSPPVDCEGETCCNYYAQCADGQLYAGCTNNLKDRIKRHKNKHIPATAKKLPLKLISYTAFSDKYRAFDFEKYLKSGSGRAFLKKHF